MNNRRKLVIALGAAALGAPDILLAQRVYRIAVLIHGTERTLGARFEALRAGLEIFFNPIPAMLPLIQANRLRALAVTSPRRFSGLPDVPTMTEAGFPQIGSTSWYGALAPPKLPATLLKTLHAEFVGALAAPDLREALVSGGAEVVGNSPLQFAEFLKKETESARELLRVSGAKRDF
jgi:tripartite-type tricarboxylate transporter receptor subunit TctC